MSDRRAFNQSERAALFDYSNGACTICGADLGHDWEADHVLPYSLGGATDVANGQALCRECNRAKGATPPFELREWQEDALTLFANGGQDFLAVACPGAGKTTFALEAARRLINAGAIERVYIVVPTTHLKKQWAVAALNFGIDLNYDFRNNDRRLANDFKGAVVTYHQVASDQYTHRKAASTARCLVVFDEIHHAGDDLSWGPAIQYAYDQDTCRRLALSGTPFRTDGKPIPFVQYDALGKVKPTYEYDYGKALTDGVVRPVEFPALDSEVRWSRAGKVKDAYLSKASDETLASALAAALRPEGDWVPSVLAVADSQLTQARTEAPDAAGLVLASDKRDARAYARLLRGITGEDPVVVLDDVPNASTQIEAFGNSTARWIVAVQMVSEGVDIPRLLVGVYATRYRTEMFFRQVVGRFIRRRNADDVMSATLFIPSIEPLLRFATTIERTVDQALRVEGSERDQAAREPNEYEDDYEALGSSEAVLHSTVRSGEGFSLEQIAMAQRLLAQQGWPPSVTPSMLLQMLRHVPQPEGVPARSPTPRLKRPTLVDDKKRQRQTINRLVNQLARHRSADGDVSKQCSYIHSDLNKMCREERIHEATQETLQRRIEKLREWMEIET